MHTYATDASDRKTVPALLAIVSICATLLLVSATQFLPITIPWWIDAPSVMTFYGIFYAIYDKFLWRLRWGPISFSDIPNIQGVWKGELVSSYKEDPTKVTVIIRQSWLHFSLCLETENSTSYTIMASLETSAPGKPELKYEYLCIPKPFAQDGMHIHRGTGHLLISIDHQFLEGDYYTFWDRQTHGKLKLHFIANNVLNVETALI